MRAYLGHDMAERVHDALLEVGENEPALGDAADNAGEVVVQQDDRRRLME